MSVSPKQSRVSVNSIVVPTEFIGNLAQLSVLKETALEAKGPDPKQTKDNKDQSDQQKNAKDGKDQSDKNVQDKSLNDMGTRKPTTEETKADAALFSELLQSMNSNSSIVRRASSKPMKHFIAADLRPDMRFSAIQNEPDISEAQISQLRALLSESVNAEGLGRL